MIRYRSINSIIYIQPKGLAPQSTRCLTGGLLDAEERLGGKI